MHLITEKIWERQCSYDIGKLAIIIIIIKSYNILVLVSDNYDKCIFIHPVY